MVSHNALISACEKGKELRLSLGVFDAMLLEGIKPEVASYSLREGHGFASSIHRLRRDATLRHQAYHTYLQCFDQCL